MRLHFDISEWFVLDGHVANFPVRKELCQKIFQYHLLELNVVRDEIGIPVHIRSGYRPDFWEKVKGRDGTSQHCYRELGATDPSIEEHSGKPHKSTGMWLKFFRLLKQTPYKRITYYPELRFFHLDYAAQERKYYISRQGWEQVGSDDIGQLIRTNQNGN